MAVGVNTGGTTPTPDGKAQPAGGGTSAGIGQASGSQSSVTKSGISGADITVTGQDATVPTGLNPEVVTGTDTSGALKKNWDGQQLQQDVQAQTSITAEFGKFASKEVGNIGDKKQKELTSEADAAMKAGETDRAQELYAEAAKWSEGGAYRVAAHAVVGGLSGGSAGAIGAATSAAAAPVLNEVQVALAEQLTNAGISDKAADAAAKLLTGTAASVVGGVVGGSAGAAATLNEDANNRQLHWKHYTESKAQCDKNPQLVTPYQFPLLLIVINEAGCVASAS